MKKKTNRIGRELICMLILFIIIIIGILLFGSYIVHNREVDSLQMQKVADLSVTAAALLDGDYLKKLSEAVSSEEYHILAPEVLQNPVHHRHRIVTSIQVVSQKHHQVMFGVEAHLLV